MLKCNTPFHNFWEKLYFDSFVGLTIFTTTFVAALYMFSFVNHKSTFDKYELTSITSNQSCYNIQYKLNNKQIKIVNDIESIYCDFETTNPKYVLIEDHRYHQYVDLFGLLGSSKSIEDTNNRHFKFIE